MGNLCRTEAPKFMVIFVLAMKERESSKGVGLPFCCIYSK